MILASTWLYHFPDDRTTNSRSHIMAIGHVLPICNVQLQSIRHGFRQTRCLENEFCSVFDCINIRWRVTAEKGREQKSTHSHTQFPGRADNNRTEFAPCFVFRFYGNSDAQSKSPHQFWMLPAWFMRFGHKCFERDYVFLICATARW